MEDDDEEEPAMEDDDEEEPVAKFGCSPTRASIRQSAFSCLERQAAGMKKRAWKKDGHHVSIDVGTVVQFGAADVDRAKTDVANVTAVVVEHVHVEGIMHYRLVAHAGRLKTVYARHQLKPLPKVGPALVGLGNWRSWEHVHEVGERQCMRLCSAVGGQGFVHCHCLGACATNRCACKKAGRACNSRCHPRNSSCTNCGGARERAQGPR